MFLNLSLFSQDTLTEKERQVLSMPDDSSKVNALIDLAFRYRAMDTRKVLHYANMALQISQQIDYTEGMAGAKNRLGSFYRQTGDYDRSMHYYTEALLLYEKMGNKKGISFCYNGIGNIFRLQKNYDKAFEYFSKALEVAQSRNDSLGVAIYLRNIGGTLTYKGDYQQAIIYLEKALEKTLQLNSPANTVSCYQLLGEYYVINNEPNIALTYYQKAFEIAEQTRNLFSIPSTMNRLGEIYIKKAAFPQAEKALFKALDYGKKLNLKNDLKDTYEILSKLYEQTGNHQKAYENLQLYTIYNDSIFSIESQSRIASIESYYEMEKHKIHIDLLSKSNELSQLRIKQQRILLTSLIAISGLIIFYLFSLWRRNKKLREARSLLAEQNEELRQSKFQIEKQAESLKKLSVIADRTINSVMLLKPNGDIEWVNNSFTRLYGYTLEEFKNAYHHNLTQVSKNLEVKQVIEECIYGQKPVIYNTQVYRSDGSTLWIQTSITPIFNDEGKIEFFVAIDTDISALKEYEAMLIKLTDELKEKAADLSSKNEEIKAQRDHLLELNKELKEKNAEIEQQAEMLQQTQIRLIQTEKMASIGNFIAGIAHEINNPINFVYGGTTILSREFSSITEAVNSLREILSSNVDTSEKINKITEVIDQIEYQEITQIIQETLEDIIHGAERTAKIIKKMQFYTRFEHEKWQFFDIHYIIQEALQTAKSNLFKNITFKTNFQPGKIQVQCLISRLTSAIVNVIQNAIDSIVDSGIIELSTQLNEQKVILEIKDNGKGIASENLTKIFDPFFTSKPIGTAMGLGLTITYGIIKEHGGEISVESQLFTGTTVRIELPANSKLA